MPFLEDDSQPIDLSRRIDRPNGFAVTPGAADLEDNSTKPAWNWGAAFRRNNEISALASSESAWTGNEPESGFNPWDKVKGTPDEANFAALSEARNEKKFEAIKTDIGRENDDRKLLDSQPWWMGLVTEGTAGVLSPTSLIPGGSFVKGAKGGIALVKAGASVGAANALSAAVQESALHSIEQTRTAGESATAIGSSFFLGGLLGAGGQALLSKAEWQKGVAALDKDLGAASVGQPAGEMPSLFAMFGETGRAPKNSSIEAPPGAQSLPDQVSTRPEPSSNSTTRATTPLSTTEGPATTFTDLELGAIDGSSNKKVLQGSDNYKALLAAAERNKPPLLNALQRVTDGIDGASVYGVRAKDEPGLREKIETKGRAPSTISDYLGGRIVVDTPEAMNAVLQRFESTGAVIEGENFVQTPKAGYRAYHLQVGLGDGTSAEIQLVPKPIADKIGETHAIRQPFKRMAEASPEGMARFKEAMERAVKVSDDAWAAAREWSSAPYTIRDVATHDAQNLTGATGTGSPASVGAAANTATALSENTIAGKAARVTAAATAQMNPLLRALHSPSAVYRQIATDLVENPLYLKKNFEGVASQPAVETLMKEYNGGLAKAIQATNDAYPEYRKAGGQLAKDEFREAVGKAMRRGDEDVFDPIITRLAQEWRAKVFDPLKKQAIDVGLLPPDVSVDTAASYFTRMWNGRKISADEIGFKGMVAEHVGHRLEKEFATSVEAHTKRLARLDQESADLNLTPEQRVTESANIKTALDTLEKSKPELTEVADRLGELRQRQIEASNTPSHPVGAEAYRSQQKALKEHGGEELKQFMAERASLRTRKRNVDLGTAGMQERSDRVLGQIADVEDANHRTMDRLLAKGQKLERDLDRLDADAFDARVNDIVESYSKVSQKAEAAAKRARDQIENIKKAAEQGAERNRLAAQKAETEALTGPPEEVAAKRALAKEAADKNRAKQEARDANITRVLEREAERQSGLAERMDKISQRLEVARGFDHDGLMDEIRIAAEKATRETSSLSLARGERIAKLSERMEAFDPAKVAERTKLIAQMRREAEAKFIERWEVGRGAIDVNPAAKQAKFGEVAKQIADEVFDALTGRAGVGARPEFITIKSRGPLKERTFHIPDLFVGSNGRAVENYLEHDVEHVARRYTRIMGADVELARKFGSVDMVDQIGKIRDDYRNLRDGITDEKQLTKLAAREKNDIADLEAVRDMLRGTNPGSPVDTNYSRIVRAANHVNYLRQMGEVALASLSETVRPAMVHGLMPYMETLGQTLTNLKGIKASVREAQIAGTVTERVLGTRLATLSEIIDPYASRGPVEAFLENMTNIASRWNGIRLLTDMQKAISAVMTQNRLLGNVAMFKDAAPKERAYLAYLGIDQSMAERIAKQFAEHGETVDKVHVANQEKWTDEVAARTYRAAISKDVDSIITTKGVADTPLFANTPTGRAMLQFKSFALASHQRVLLRGLQEGQARFVGGLIAMTTIGMMATWLKAISGNRVEKLQDIGKNPGWWIAEGFDKAGIFSVPTELANTFEKATGFNPIKTPMKAFDEGSAISQKNQNRSLMGSIAGPSAGLIDDASSVMGIPQKLYNGEDVTQGQKNAAERLLPFNSYLGIRQFLRYVVNPPQ